MWKDILDIVELSVQVENLKQLVDSATLQEINLRLSGGWPLITEVPLRRAAIADEGWRAAVLVTVALEKLVTRHPSVQFWILVHTLSVFHCKNM